MVVHCLVRSQKAWTLLKLLGNSVAMSTHNAELLQVLYKSKEIRRSEFMYGKNFRCSGGLELIEENSKLLNITSASKVLDVGCGTGGNTFYMAEVCGATVVGVDFSSNMLETAKERLQEYPAEVQQNVTLEYGDITKKEYPAETFDIIYSRDTILHISEKVELFTKFKSWLKPGGSVLIMDFCVGDQELSPRCLKWINDYQYNMCTVKTYGGYLESAGFTDVTATDITSKVLPFAKAELESFHSRKEEFFKEFDDEDYNYIVSHWACKIELYSKGDQVCGHVIAKKH